MFLRYMLDRGLLRSFFLFIRPMLLYHDADMHQHMSWKCRLKIILRQLINRNCQSFLQSLPLVRQSIHTLVHLLHSSRPVLCPSL